jgi:hypothetical protein
MAPSNSGTNRGRFVKGRQKTGGRQKGSTNKASALLRDAFILAASQAGDMLAEQRADEILKRIKNRAQANRIRDEEGGLTKWLPAVGGVRGACGVPFSPFQADPPANPGRREKRSTLSHLR